MLCRGRTLHCCGFSCLALMKNINFLFLGGSRTELEYMQVSTRGPIRVAIHAPTGSSMPQISRGKQVFADDVPWPFGTGDQFKGST